MSLLLPIVQPPGRGVLMPVPGFSLQIDPLEVVPSLFLDSLVFVKTVVTGMVSVHFLCSSVVISRLVPISVGCLKSHGVTVVSSSWVLFPIST